MGALIKNRQIDRICIIDDNEEFRLGLEDTVQESDFIPVSQNERVDNLEMFLNDIVQINDAVVSDHQLKKKNYFPVNGAEVVYRCYERGIPSVLVTRYEPHIGEIRKFRKNIPVILNPEEFEPDTLYKSLEVCIDEFNGEIKPARKIWRSLVRIDSLDKNHIYVIIPSWDTNEIISLNIEDLPEKMRSVIEPDLRLHAKVNIGCESANDLFFLDWETK
jgi:hypothetical protein